MTFKAKDADQVDKFFHTHELPNGELMMGTVNHTLIESAMIEGLLFWSGDTTTLSTGQASSISITTPATPGITFQGSVNATSSATVEFFENSSTTGGVPVVLPNADRSSANTLGATILQDPTLDVLGDVLVPITQIGGGQSWNPQPGSISSGFILKPSTTYILRATSTSDNNVLQANWQFIEGGV